MNEPIKSCPFCHGSGRLESEYSYRERRHIVYVRCMVCGARGRTYTSIIEPEADAWNGRACRDAVEAWNGRQ